jgi:hypothetical protein
LADPKQAGAGGVERPGADPDISASKSFLEYVVLTATAGYPRWTDAQVSIGITSRWRRIKLSGTWEFFPD